MKDIFLFLLLLLFSVCLNAQGILIKSRSSNYQTSFRVGTVVKIKVNNLLENGNLSLVVDSISSDSFYGHDKKLSWVQISVPLNEIKLLKFKSSVSRDNIRITLNSILIPFTSLIFIGTVEEVILLVPVVVLGSIISSYNISYIKRRFRTDKYAFITTY